MGPRERWEAVRRTDKVTGPTATPKIRKIVNHPTAPDAETQKIETICRSCGLRRGGCGQLDGGAVGAGAAAAGTALACRTVMEATKKMIAATRSRYAPVPSESPA